MGLVAIRVLRVLRTVALIVTIAVIVFFATIGYNRDPAAYVLMATAIGPGVAWFLLRKAVFRAEAQSRGRRRWGGDPERVARPRHTRLEELFAAYTEHTKDDQSGYVDDRTWNDLDMEEVIDQVDVCFTFAGRNELRRTLRHALPDSEVLARRTKEIDAFTTDQEHRESVAIGLATIGEDRDADPASVLWGDAAHGERRLPLYVLMSSLSVLSILVTAFVSLTTGMLMILTVFVTNMWIHYRHSRHVAIYIAALRVMSRMIEAAAELPVDQRNLSVVRRARGALRWLLTGAPNPTMRPAADDLFESLFIYLKIYFQIDMIAYERIIGRVRSNAAAYQQLYQEIGALDATYSLASCRERRQTCSVRTGEGVSAVGLYHPLIPRPVANTISLSSPGAIVTGTNMAGKSTFLRTVGINALFAQSAGFAFATEYTAARFRVLSSIDKGDDLAEGKSFYYDEAERIYRMMERLDADEPALLLIDELLSGTNSLERESASIAILHYLSQHNAVTIAATHDVAIARGVADQYALHYFTDDANEDGLTFDYLLHEGVVQTRNAIKLLRLIGYPDDVIEAALKRTEAPEGT